MTKPVDPKKRPGTGTPTTRQPGKGPRRSDRYGITPKPRIKPKDDPKEK